MHPSRQTRKSILQRHLSTVHRVLSTIIQLSNCEHFSSQLEVCFRAKHGVPEYLCVPIVIQQECTFCLWRLCFHCCWMLLKPFKMLTHRNLQAPASILPSITDILKISIETSCLLAVLKLACWENYPHVFQQDANLRSGQSRFQRGMHQKWHQTAHCLLCSKQIDYSIETLSGKRLKMFH